MTSELGPPRVARGLEGEGEGVVAGVPRRLMGECGESLLTRSRLVRPTTVVTEVVIVVVLRIEGGAGLPAVGKFEELCLCH